MRKYDDQFKREAVRKILDGQSTASFARELGVKESQLHKWKRPALRTGDGIKSSAELKEIAELKKRNRELEMEFEILKKAVLIFGRGS